LDELLPMMRGKRTSVLMPSGTRRPGHAPVLHCTPGFGGEPPLQGRLFSAVLKGLDNLIDRGRLDEHIVEASVCRLGMRLGVVRPSRVGDKSDLLAVALAQSTRHLQTVNRRQFEVDEGDLRPGALRLGQGGFAIVRDLRAVADRAKHLGDSNCEGLIIFDD
jgi:hypothetical protein